MKVLCQFCKMLEEKTLMTRVDDKNFHEACAKLYTDRKDLYATITRVLHLKAPGPKNIKLVEYYRDTNHFTYEGMNNALIYHYDIKRGDTAKAEERIGIIPFVYEEAQEYYTKKKLEVEKLLQSVEKAKQIGEQTVQVNIEKRREIKILQPLEMDNPFEENE